MKDELQALKAVQEQKSMKLCETMLTYALQGIDTVISVESGGSE